MSELILFLAFILVVGLIGPKEECKNEPCKCRKCKTTL
jgi:hypothetical protein